MRTLQDYQTIFSEIADNLGYTGESIEILIQLLSQAVYIGEVENISYLQEASLEKAILLDSKIQHCMDEMYSVYRGSCPRVILYFKPLKDFKFSRFDRIIVSNNFSVYYLGYYTESGEIVEGDLELKDTSDPVKIIGLIAKESKIANWTLDENNPIYVSCYDNSLSDDVWVKVAGKTVTRTRQFADHLIKGSVFDLTLPGFGSRLYLPGVSGATINTPVWAQYFIWSEIDSYNTGELKKINLRGAELLEIGSESEIAPGVMIIPETKRDSNTTVHYRASRDRYINSMMRSNSDVGDFLREDYPEKVMDSSYEFSGNHLDIYYIPQNQEFPLTSGEKQAFIDSRGAYYVTDDIEIKQGTRYTANFNISLELFQGGSEIEKSVKEILGTYENRFDVTFNDATKNSIIALIAKISEVKQVKSMDITYINDAGQVLSQAPSGKNSYFKISFTLNVSFQLKA